MRDTRRKLSSWLLPSSSTAVPVRARSAATSASRPERASTVAEENVGKSGIGHNIAHVDIHPPIQTKLTVSQPGDPYEQEADRVADAVLRLPEAGTTIANESDPTRPSIIARPVNTRNTPRLQRQENPEPKSLEAREDTGQTGARPSLLRRQDAVAEHNDAEHRPDDIEAAEPAVVSPVQRKRDAPALSAEPVTPGPVQVRRGCGQALQVAAGVETKIYQSLDKGASLSTSARGDFEPRFGHDFNQVRIHADSEAAHLARSVNAQAFTYGRDIYFAAGRYKPHSVSGRKLLAHELAHVTQNSAKPMLYRDKDPATQDPVPGPGVVPVPDASTVGALHYKYPWQYPDVRQAIYPHREEALTTFLRVHAEIEIDKGLLPIKDVTAQEIKDERDRLEMEKTQTNDALKSDIQNQTLRIKWGRLKDDLDYLSSLPKGSLPTKPAALERVKKRWTAYLYSKKDDAGKDLEHDGLLGRVLDRFDADTSFTRYPKWLRYMVIHFSGLRYESAHGSYAPATTLVKQLKTEEVRQTLAGAGEKDTDTLVVNAETDLAAEAKTAPRARAATIKSRLADFSAVETMLQKAFSNKGDASKQKAFEELMEVEAMRAKISDIGDPDLEAELDARAAELTKTIGGARVAGVKRQVAAAKKRRQQALVVHEIERAQQALSTLDDAQALAMLKKMRADGAFPDWFWLEIERATSLRLEAEGTDWTRKMTYAERADLKKAGPVTRQWLSILDVWKKDATAWRAKHGKDQSLVVSRAVCNEIAEQSLHVRGVQPKGGIGQKASWYANTAQGRTFARPEKANLQTGASLFWAEWQDTAPTDNVHKVRSDLFPILRTEENATISDGMRDSANRTYHVAADKLVTRTVPIGTSVDPSVPPPTKTQWLVWKHEAIVHEVDEQRGRIVTFETGPIGTRTRSLTGTQKHPNTGILDNPNIYIGYAPSGPEPKEIDQYLKDILPGR